MDLLYGHVALQYKNWEAVKTCKWLMATVVKVEFIRKILSLSEG